MASLHPMTLTSPIPQLDVFTLPPVNTAIVDVITTTCRPVGVLSDPTAIIEYNWETGIDEYINFGETYLEFKMQIDISKTDTNAPKYTDADWDNIWTVNNLLPSLFRQKDLLIGGKNVTLSTPLAEYRAYFEDLLGASREAKESSLTLQGYYVDNPGKFDTFHHKRAQLIRPESNEKNKEHGKIVHLISRLHLDIANQDKYFLGGCKYKLTLIPNHHKFYLMYNSKVEPKVKFLEATIYLQRVKVSRDLLAGHLKGLSQSTAKYHISRNIVKAHTINSGKSDASIDNICVGQIPRKIYVSFVKNSAFNGDPTKNPYNFEHFNINSIVIYVNGLQVPHIGYKPNFEKSQYLRELYGLFETAQQTFSQSSININRDTYVQGFTIFGFNLEPDFGLNASHVNPVRRGSVRLDINFTNPLTETITALLYAEYDGLIEVDSNREVDFNFQ